MVGKNNSYNSLYESFLIAFPEFKRQVVDWERCTFTAMDRHIKINLKNKCKFFFGCVKCNNEWVWYCTVEPSDDLIAKYDIKTETEAETE